MNGIERTEFVPVQSDSARSKDSYSFPVAPVSSDRSDSLPAGGRRRRRKTKKATRKSRKTRRR